jgi:thymidylate synthase ThyX
MNKNSVELIGSYGGDIEHACSAWQSTDRVLSQEKRERIPAMLTQLATNGHHTPFEKSALHFTVTTDIATHIHLLKHRIGVSINAESARYKQIREDRIYIPEDWPIEWQQRLETARFFRGYNSQIQSDVMFNFRSFMHFRSCGMMLTRKTKSTGSRPR